jgi:translin
LDWLTEITERARRALDESNAAREETLALSREIIRTSANTIRAVHRAEFEQAAAMLEQARAAAGRLRERVRDKPALYGAGYVHDCQKELAEAALTLALVKGDLVPGPQALGVEIPAFLNGMGETVGELRRHVLDVIRAGDVARGEAILQKMDDIYSALVTFDYPDALTGGLRRTTDSVRGILEKTRGDLTTSLRQNQLQEAIGRALTALGASSDAGTPDPDRGSMPIQKPKANIQNPIPGGSSQHD